MKKIITINSKNKNIGKSSTKERSNWDMKNYNNLKLKKK